MAWPGMVGICVSHAASLSLRALVTFRMKPDAGTTSCRATTAAKATATEEPLYINERCIYVLYTIKKKGNKIFWQLLLQYGLDPVSITVTTPSWVVKNRSPEETKYGKSMPKLSTFGLVLHFC